MTREPLMLNDTAMVLLQQYGELDDTYLTELAGELSLMLAGDILHGLRNDIFTMSLLKGVIKSELLYEIWLLWRFQDIPITRALEWHLVFNEALMAMAETLFASWNEYPRHYRRYISHTAQEVSLFFDVLSKDYETVLVAHTIAAENCS